MLVLGEIVKEILGQFYLANLKAQTNPPSRYSMTQLHQNTCQHYSITAFKFPALQRHIGFVRDYNSHNARSIRESIF